MRSFEFLVGYRYLLSRKSNAFLSVISIISVLGVAVGVMALIVVLSVVSGFQDDFRKRILGNNAPLILFDFAGPLKNYTSLAEKIDKVEGVTGSSPFSYHEVLMHAGTGRATGIVVYGVDPQRVQTVTSLKADVKEGALEDLLPKSDENLPGLVVGKELAKQLMLRLGSEVNLISPSGELTPFGFGPKMRQFRVVGIFKSGLFEYDSKSAYMNLPQAQEIFGTPGEVNGIQINVANLADAVNVAKRIQPIVGSDYYLRHWMELNEDLFNAFKLEKTVFFIVVVMIVLVASFNIIGTLTLLVMMKRREISILKTMGATNKSVMKVFMAAGSLIGGVGTFLGLVLGISLTVMLRYYFPFPLNSNVYQVDQLPIRINPLEVGMVIICALLISFLSTILPARKAAIIEPSEGLRYE